MILTIFVERLPGRRCPDSASKGGGDIGSQCPGCAEHLPLPAGTALRHDLVVGDAHLETSPLRPGMRRRDGHSAWVPALVKPVAIGVAALSLALCAGALGRWVLLRAQLSYPSIRAGRPGQKWPLSRPLRKLPRDCPHEPGTGSLATSLALTPLTGRRGTRS